MAHNFKTLVDQRIDAYKQQKPKRTGSFIITLFGDLMPINQDGIWLQDVIELLADFGISAGLVRTSMTRLVQDGWLIRHQVGRNSVYNFAPSAKADAQAAADKIYQINLSEWKGDFQQLILLDQNDHSRSARENVRKEIINLGFVKLRDAVFIKPNYAHKISKEAIQKKILTEFILSDHVAFELSDKERSLLHPYWDLDDLQSEYQEFYDNYQEFITLIKNESASKLSPRESLYLRLLLIHDYRKICLKDPMLPQDLLNSEWMGYKCQNLVKVIYLELQPLVNKLLLEKNISLAAQHDARFK